MSAYVVVPDSIISSAASRVPARTNSGVTVFASAGKMYFCSQSISARSSASPRYKTIAAWVWVLMRPGMTTWPAASIVSFAANLAAMAAGVSMPTMSRPSIAIAPGERTRPAGSTVTTIPPEMTRETGRRAACTERTAATASTAAEMRSMDGRSYPFSPFPFAAPVLYSEPVPLHLVPHPLVHDALATLRDAGTPPELFRRVAVRISLLLAAEATRDVPNAAVTVGTPLGPAESRRVSGDVVVVPVLRAGLGMLDAILELLPAARVGHIGLQRDELTAVASRYYSKLPADMSRSFVLMIDPMLATGGSAVAALDLLRNAGARNVRMICIVAAPEGIALVERHHPDVHIFTPVVDHGLNERKFIVPGLGDFGDRLYGTQ